MSEQSANTLARRSLLRIDRTKVMAAVDSLNLHANAKVSAVVGVPLRQLQQRRDVESFSATAPILAVKGLLEVLALEPLEAMIEALGEHADSPSFEQLSDAVDQLLASGTSADDVVAVLAYAVSESFPAAPHCRRLFDERELFLLPALPEVEVRAVSGSTKVVDPEIRAQRKARRDALSQKKKAKSTSRPPHAKKPKGSTPSVTTSDSTREPVATREPVVRRAGGLTTLERERFSETHAMVGVVLLVDVPFDGVDAETPDVTSKERPALVVAGSGSELLVRALYSTTSTTRRVFSPWRRLGLDHVSYLDDLRVVVSPGPAPRRLGVVTDEEWNALV